jgi:hypothetical protein
MMLLVTTAVIVGSYTVNLKVSAERTQVERLRRTLVSDAISIRDLQGELRTRARLPEMQRWNDHVLQMSAPAAGQYLRNPVQLARFAVVPGDVPQPLQRAVTPPSAVAVPGIMVPIIRAAYTSASAPPQVSTRVPTLASAVRAEPQPERRLDTRPQTRPAPRLVTIAYRPGARPGPPALVVLPDTPGAVGMPVDLLNGGGQ